jgi:uncharacterized protein YdbL (DUF1318 family)
MKTNLHKAARSAARRTASLLPLVLATMGCTFNFELTSQRTALENQVMGAYKELDDDLVLVSSVRAAGTPAPATVLAPGQKKALDARQNQEFNRDDVDELKDKEVLGETAAGGLALLPRGVGHATAVDGAVLKLAATLVAEENRDRAEVWRRIIDANSNLSDRDLPDVRKTYAKLQREATQPGQWFQDDGGTWQRKPGAAAAAKDAPRAAPASTP